MTVNVLFQIASGQKVIVLFLQAFTLESLTRALCSNGNVLDYDSVNYVPSLLTLIPYVVLIFQR